MCGRYTLFAGKSEITKEFNIKGSIPSYEPSYNVAPGQDVFAIIHDGREKRAGHLRWGLVPSWAKDKKIGYKMINARSETAHEKPSFKQLMSRKRCLIIADSFYEWRKTDKKKQPERIQVSNRNLFAFAGLWDKWKQGDETLFTCTMLTKDSNEFMKDIHHRMPIILPKEKEKEWISPYVQRSIDAYNFLQTIQTEELISYTVSNYVNYANNNDSTCIESLV